MQKMVDWLIGKSSPQPLKTKTVQERFTVKEPSFSDLFSIVEFDEEKQVFY